MYVPSWIAASYLLVVVFILIAGVWFLFRGKIVRVFSAALLAMVASPGFDLVVRGWFSGTPALGSNQSPPELPAGVYIDFRSGGAQWTQLVLGVICALALWHLGSIEMKHKLDEPIDLIIRVLEMKFKGALPVDEIARLLSISNERVVRIIDATSSQIAASRGTPPSA